MIGKFIVLDGVDGSGKGTQCTLLLERLKKEGFDVEFFDFPQYGKKSAAAVEEFLNGNFGLLDEVSPYQASVFYAVDRFSVRNEMRSALKSGKIILCNRYTSASMIHQSGRIQDEKELGNYLSWLEDFEFRIMNIPRPDKVFFLNVPFDIAFDLVLKKKKEDRNYLEGGKKQDLLEESKDHLALAHKRACELSSRFNEWEEVLCVDSEKKLKSIEEIHDDLYKRVLMLLK